MEITYDLIKTGAIWARQSLCFWTVSRSNNNKITTGIFQTVHR